MLRFGGLDAAQVHWIRLTHQRLGAIDLADWSGIILGGGPFNVSDPPSSKSDIQQRVESELTELLTRVIDVDFPFLGCCYGVGTLQATCLAWSPACPVQAFRVGANVYATQFHPELDLDGLCTRIDVYQHYGYFPPETADELKAAARKHEARHA